MTRMVAGLGFVAVALAACGGSGDDGADSAPGSDAVARDGSAGDGPLADAPAGIDTVAAAGTITADRDGIAADFSTDAYGTYNTGLNMTRVTGNGAADGGGGPTIITILFASQTTGEFQCGNTSDGHVVNYVASNGTAHSSWDVDDCTITVTTYGGIGGTIEGTFQAEVEPIGGGTPVDFTTGVFSVPHLADS